MGLSFEWFVLRGHTAALGDETGQLNFERCDSVVGVQLWRSRECGGKLTIKLDLLALNTQQLGDGRRELGLDGSRRDLLRLGGGLLGGFGLGGGLLGGLRFLALAGTLFGCLASGLGDCLGFAGGCARLLEVAGGKLGGGGGFARR